MNDTARLLSSTATILIITISVLMLVDITGSHLIDRGTSTYHHSTGSIDDLGIYPTTDQYSIDMVNGTAHSTDVTLVGSVFNVSPSYVVTNITVHTTGDSDTVRIERSDGLSGYDETDQEHSTEDIIEGPSQMRPVVENLTGTYSGYTVTASPWFLSGEGIYTRRGQLKDMGQTALVIIVSSLLVLMGVSRWQKRKERAATGASKAFIVAVAAVLLAGVGAGASVTADYPTDVLDSGVTEHTFTGLDQTSEYTVVAVTEGGNQSLTRFTTDSNGAARVSFVVSPVEQNVRLDRDGYRYFLRDSAGDKEMDIPAYYGPQLNALDVFGDGVISDVWVSTDGSLNENSGTPYGVLSAGGLTAGVCVNSSVKVNAGDVFDANVRTTEGSDVTVKLHSTRSSCTSGSTSPHDSITFNNVQASQDRFTIETEPGDDQATVSWAGNTDTLSLPSTENAYFEIISNSGINHNLQFRNASIHPSRSDWFGSLGPGSTEAANIFHGPGIYNWQNEYAVTDDGSAGYEWRSVEGGEFSAFIGDAATSNSLEVVNTEGGVSEFLAVDSNKFELFSELSPSDDTSVTTPFQVFEFVPTENLRDIYGEQVSVGMQYTNGSGGFTDMQGTFQSGCLGQDYVDFDGNGVSMDLSACIDNQEPVRFEGDISDVDGQITWRFFINGTEGTITTAPTAFSEERDLTRVVPTSNVEALYPRDGAVVEDDTPEFTASFSAAEPGSLQLAVDGIVRKTWRFDDTATGTRSFEPSSALPTGLHTYRFTYTGDSGQSFQSDQVSFTVDNVPEVNVSLLDPPDNLVTTNRTIDLAFNVERTYDVNASVYLNQREVGDISLDAGTSNETVTVTDLGINEYTWQVLVQNGSTTVSSEKRDFEVSENVTLNPVQPRNGQVIESPPVVFTVNVSSSAPGQLELLIDGEPETATNVDEDFDGSKEIVLTRDAIDSGKHSYSWRLTTDSGNEFVTESRTFTLLSPGVQDECPTDGKLLGIFDVMLESGLGTSCGVNAVITAAFLTAVIGGLTALASPVIGIVTGGLMVLGFTVAGWIPALFTTVLVIIAAAIVARWGREVFGG